MQVALRDFRSSLDRIRDVSNDITAEAAAALGNTAVLRRHETIQFASTVILSGYFESFLRELARAFVRDLSGLALPFAALPDVVRHSHFEHGAHVLTNVAKAERRGIPPRFPTNTTDLAARLHSVAQAVPYTLVWEAFADTGANPGPDVVREFLRRLGVRDVWPTLGQKTAATAPHRTDTWLRVGLESFIGVRNECAHAGAATVQVLPSDLRTYCDLLEALAEAMVEVLDDTRQRLAASAAPPAPVTPPPTPPPTTPPPTTPPPTTPPPTTPPGGAA